MTQPCNVLIVGSELTPLAKTGGLADVLGALPKALQSLVDNIWLALPYYNSIPKEYVETRKKVDSFSIQIGNNTTRITVWQITLPGTTVPLFLFHNNRYLSKGRPYEGEKVYDPFTNKTASSKIGQRLRFLVFSQAVYTFLKRSKLPITILHTNDYHTAALQVLCNQDETLQNIHQILTVHNLSIPGSTPLRYLKLLNWNTRHISTSAELKRKHGPRLLRLAIDNASAIVAVSPQYAKEILTPEFGHDFVPLLKHRKRDIYGILNGIDEELFNPAKDKFIYKKFTRNQLNKKLLNKLHLQKLAGLPQNKTLPIFGFVHRLSQQKGIELITELEPFLKSIPAQFIFAGVGAKQYVDMLQNLARNYPNKIYFHNKFDVPFSQQLFAGSDVFLMPSLYEPCGLSQIIAMRYGSIPIVRSVGGLKDTVHEGINGFTFHTNSSATLKRTMRRTLDTYYTHPQQWKKLMQNSMAADYSWHTAARQYVTLYKKLLDTTPSL